LLAHRLYGHTGQLQHIGDALCGSTGKRNP
jgi:hypothetical protein